MHHTTFEKKYWPSSFQEVINDLLLKHDARCTTTDDDWRRPIATGHLSDSGDQKKVCNTIYIHKPLRVLNVCVFNVKIS